MKISKAKVWATALAASLTATFLPAVLPTPPQQAQAADLVFTDKKVVVTERYDAPRKNITLSQASLDNLQRLIDHWTAVGPTKLKVGSFEVYNKAFSMPIPDANGLYEMDCSSFLQAVLEGVTWERSRYVPTNKVNSSDLGVTMPFFTYTKSGLVNRRVLANELAKWAYTHGYWYAARPDYSNVRVGDVLFWHAYAPTDVNGTPIFKQVSHVAFVTKPIDADGYVEIADSNGNYGGGGGPGAGINTRRKLHIQDLHRLQVYSAARFPLDQMWDWEVQDNQNKVNRGWLWQEATNSWTYLDEVTGARPAANKWMTIDGKNYFFDGSGNALFGQVSVGGTTYNIHENYGAVTNATWASLESTYDKYFGAGAAKYDHFTTATQGWQKIDGVWRYYIYDSGYMVRDGWQFINEPTVGRSLWHYCLRSGVCTDQWKTESNRTYYTYAGPYDYARGWRNINNVWYHFSPYAVMDKGLTVVSDSVATAPGPGSTTVDPNMTTGTFYLDPITGARQTGWKQVDGKWYYFDPANNGKAATGWKWIYEPTLGRAAWNYFLPNGEGLDQLKMENGMTFLALAGPDDYARGWNTINGFTRYFRNTPAASMATSFQKIDNNWYFLREGTGTKAYGWQYVNGKWRYLDPTTGTMKLAGTWYIKDSYDVITWDSVNGYYSIPKTITVYGRTYKTLAGPYTYAP